MSEIRTDLLSNRLGNGPAPLRDQWASKAWVNFNGTGTVAIRESRNTSSITDNGTGDYTKNMTVAQADANYASNGGARSQLGTGSAEVFVVHPTQAPTSSTLRFLTHRSGTGNLDIDIMSVAIVR